MAKAGVVGQRAQGRGGTAPNRAAGKTANGATGKASGGTRNGRSLPDDPAVARLEHAMHLAASGDFSVRLPARRKDDIGRLEAAFNQMAARNAAVDSSGARNPGTTITVRGRDAVTRPGASRRRAGSDGSGGSVGVNSRQIGGRNDRGASR